MADCSTRLHYQCINCDVDYVNTTTKRNDVTCCLSVVAMHTLAGKDLIADQVVDRTQEHGATAH